jgi:hypothetical protein
VDLCFISVVYETMKNMIWNINYFIYLATYCMSSRLAYIILAARADEYGYFTGP